MTGALVAGDILVEGGTYLPKSLMLQNEPYLSGWAAIKDIRATFEKAVQDAGWSFFFMAGKIQATAIGWDKQKTLRSAFRRLVRDVKSLHCNCIEITRVTNKSFLRIPYVTVSANSRHLQEGQTFSGR